MKTVLTVTIKDDQWNTTTEAIGVREILRGIKPVATASGTLYKFDNDAVNKLTKAQLLELNTAGLQCEGKVGEFYVVLDSTKLKEKVSDKLPDYATTDAVGKETARTYEDYFAIGKVESVDKKEVIVSASANCHPGSENPCGDGIKFEEFLKLNAEFSTALINKKEREVLITSEKYSKELDIK